MEPNADTFDNHAHEDRFMRLVVEIAESVSSLLQSTVVSIPHVRATVCDIARHYPEFQVWAGDVRDDSYVVTIWKDWVGDGDKQEELVTVTIPNNMVIA